VVSAADSHGSNLGFLGLVRTISFDFLVIPV
jgi:hypothetical protein